MLVENSVGLDTYSVDITQQEPRAFSAILIPQNTPYSAKNFCRWNFTKYTFQNSTFRNLHSAKYTFPL